MNEFLNLLRDLGPLGASISIATIFIAFCWNGDGGISDEFRKTISARLMSLGTYRGPLMWPQLFVRLFDHVFGSHHISWFCFFRSFVASFCAFIVVIFIWYTIYPEDTRAYIETVNFMDVKFFIVFFLIFNVVPDYFSLLETRFCIKLLAKSEHIWSITILLLLDAVFTALIFFTLLFFLFYEMPVSSEPSQDIVWTELLERLKLGLFLQSKHSWEPSLGLFFYTTFLTSIWLWLFALSYGALLIAQRMNIAFRFLIWSLPVKTYPIRTLGIIGGVLGALSYWLFAFLYNLTAVSSS